MDKLKSCPFCGAEAEIRTESKSQLTIVRCPICDIRTPLLRDKEKSIGLWNSRINKNEYGEWLEDHGNEVMKMYEVINMTAKEAIRRLREHMKVHGMTEHNAVLITHAHKMAIKALEENSELKRLLQLASAEVHRPYPEYKYRFEIEAEKLLGGNQND